MFISPGGGGGGGGVWIIAPRTSQKIPGQLKIGLGFRIFDCGILIVI